MFLLLLIIHIERPKFSRKHFRSLETSDRREMGGGGEERRGEERRGEKRRERERERERDSEG